MEPVAKRWPRDQPIPHDVYRSSLLEAYSKMRGFEFDSVRMWRDESSDATVVQAVRSGMFAEVAVDYTDPRWREIAVERLDRALGTCDSTLTSA